MIRDVADIGREEVWRIRKTRRSLRKLGERFVWTVSEIEVGGASTSETFRGEGCSYGDLGWAREREQVEIMEGSKGVVRELTTA